MHYHSYNGAPSTQFVYTCGHLLEPVYVTARTYYLVCR